MAQPTTRAEFREWCLRALGKPVIEINVDDDQVDDRIEESLSLYQDYHFDGTRLHYYKHVVTADDIANEYITISDDIIGISDIFDIGDSVQLNNIFNLQYQLALHELYDLSQYSLQHYVQAQQHISLIEDMLIGKQPIRYNRHQNRLYIDMNWSKITAGRYIIVKCYEILDPDTYTDVWKDRWLQQYATAKIKWQWGENLSKYDGMVLAGGITFNGDRIRTEAQEEIRRLEEELINSYSLPSYDLVG